MRALSVIVALLALAACERANIEEAEHLFMGQCISGSSGEGCATQVKEKIASFKALKDDALRVDMLVDACMDNPTMVAASNIRNLVEDKRPKTVRERCRQAAITIVSGGKYAL